MKNLKATLVLDAKATLGEGAIWHPTEQKLYWVDIEERKLHIFDPDTSGNTSLDVGERIGTVVPASKGGVLVALQNGIHHLNTGSGNLTLLADPIAQDDIRFNDGKCDPAGRFWVGTMALDARKGAAVLYCLDTDGTIKEVLDDLTISNGIAWSQEEKTMYFTDTPTHQLMAFDYEKETGRISNGRTIVTIPEEDGSPDGFTLDAEGNIWVALHGGGVVVCYDSSTGNVLYKVEVDCPQTTSCAFGGKNLDTLFITTGRQGLPDDKLHAYPNSGGLFAVKPGVKGVDANFYGGEVYT